MNNRVWPGKAKILWNDLAGGTQLHRERLMGRVETLLVLRQLQQLSGKAFVDALEGHIFDQFHEASDTGGVLREHEAPENQRARNQRIEVAAP
jgi:hypothetical protein